jgi:hypothetical protein
MKKYTKPKWTFDGLYVWDKSIVGTASKAPNGLWYAHGCEDEWEDARLGSFKKERDARKAVEKWVKEHCS